MESRLTLSYYHSPLLPSPLSYHSAFFYTPYEPALTKARHSFIPGYFVLLGWPLFPPFMFNGHMYGLGREPWTKV